MKNIIFALLVTIGSGVGRAQQHFTSPNKIFTAWIDSDNVILRNNTTGKETSLGSTLHVLYFRWTADSSTIIDVQQIAGGSIMTTFSLIRGWEEKDFPPPKNGDVCNVVNVKIGWDKIYVTYKVRERIAGPDGINWTCGFEIDTKTATTCRVAVKTISDDDYDALKGVYDPSIYASE